MNKHDLTITLRPVPPFSDIMRHFQGTLWFGKIKGKYRGEWTVLAMEIKDGVQQEIIISSGILDSIFEHGELL